MLSNRIAATLFDASPDGMLVVDTHGAIIYANPASADMFGVPNDVITAMKIEEFVPSEVRDAHRERRAQYVEEPESRPMGTGLQLQAQTADGTLFPVEISLSPVEFDGSTYTIATVRDVSQRQADAALLALLRDRERIARDLHDMVIQKLFGAGLGLQAVAAAAEPPEVGRRIHQVVDQLDDTIRELRSAIFQLSVHPEDSTIADRIRQLIDERARMLSATPDVSIDPSVDDVAQQIAEHLLATLGEALSNVGRHAQADHCSIRIECRDRLRLTVIDDGVGVPDEPSRRSGLSTMRDRALVLGGSCEIGRNEAGGTTVDWSVPL